MSLTTSTVTPLMVQTPLNSNIPDHVVIINPDGSITYEPNRHYQQPTIIRRSYAKSRKSKHRYALDQEGKSYRCCQWCRHCWTRKCPVLDFCDRIYACPLVFFILSALFLLLLLTALLALFGLLPEINASQRYYGIISTLSISNTTTYIYGMDKLCGKYSVGNSCWNITTSTSIISFVTTMVTNRTITIYNYSYMSFILLCFCLTIYCVYRRINSDIM